MDEGGGGISQPGEFQTGFFYALTLFFDHKDLILSAVFEKKIHPCGICRGRSMNHGPVLFYHSTLLHGFGQGGSGLLGSGVDHHTAHIQIQPVDGKNLSAQRIPEQLGHTAGAVLRADTHGLDGNGKILVGIQDVHKCPPE